MKISEMKGRGRDATMDLEELPDEFEGILTDEELKTDSFGKECLYWVIEIDGGTAIQKFAPLHEKVLAERLDSLGIKDTDELLGARMLFERVEFVIGKNRWIPKKLVKQSKM